MSSPISIIHSYSRPEAFNMGDVLVRSWQVLTRNLLTFLLLCSLAELPSLIISLAMHPKIGQLSWTQAFAGILKFILQSLAQAMVVYAAFQDLRGRKVSASESLSHGLSQLLSVIGLSILVGLAVGLGMILLLIPGLIALTAFSVALPACVVERDGPSSSMSRSRLLTSGHRWPIFWVALAMAVISYIVTFLIMTALTSTNYVTTTVVTWVWTTLLLSFQSVYAAILYHDLRAVTEGVGIEEIAAVFD